MLFRNVNIFSSTLLKDIAETSTRATGKEISAILDRLVCNLHQVVMGPASAKGISTVWKIEKLWILLEIHTRSCRSSYS